MKFVTHMVAEIKKQQVNLSLCIHKVKYKFNCKINGSLVDITNL